MSSGSRAVRPAQGRARRRWPLASAALPVAWLALVPLVARGGLFLGAWCGLSSPSARQLPEFARRPSTRVRAADGGWPGDERPSWEGDGDEQSPEEDEFDASRAKPSSMDIDAITNLVNRQIGAKGGAMVPAGSAEGGAWDTDALVAEIQQARTWEKVIDVVGRAEDLEVKHIATVCRRLAFMVSRLDEEIVNDRGFQKFAVQAEEILSRERPDTHTTASLLWSISILRYPLPQLLGWLPRIHDAFPGVAKSMSLQNLTNSLSAIAKLERSVPQPMSVVMPIVQQIADKVDIMDPMHISATIWSLGELEVKHNEIFALTDAVLQTLSLERLREFNSKELSNFVWGMAQMNERDELLLRDVSRVITEEAETMSMKEIAFDIPKIICAFARLRYENMEVLEAAAEAILQRQVVKRINHWGICALKWSWPQLHADLPSSIRRVAHLLDVQVGKRRLSASQVERARMGPQEWSF